MRAAKGSFEETVAPKFTEDNTREVMAQYAGISDLTDDEANTIKQALKEKASNPYGPANAAADIASKRALVGWTTGGHTGVDVPVFAFGPEAAAFTGHMNNTDINKRMMKALGLK